MIPHQRDRQWIRGVRLDVASSVPSTMPLPLHSLQCFLVNLPNIQESDLTPKQQTNLSFYKTSIEKALAIYEDRTHIAVVEIDRRPSAKFGLQFCIDRIPSMRCKGPDYLVMSTEDMHKEAQARRFFRLLHVKERLILQGVHSWYADKISPTFSTHIAGNAFSKSMCAAATVPVLKEIAKKVASDFEGIRKNVEGLRHLVRSTSSSGNVMTKRKCSEPQAAQKVRRQVKRRRTT